ncbi:CMGC/CDK protein kinase [Thecamonas trahens ATCC 50062]|uniref:[RNA-polymerase]-subunit kinase n=1 Tax=Thecamonas trahens ATCC 50062 TaxID=461836 RepID=A0A0L0DJV7_THETB|nr:CMGC/CDK protein kinase [Thecamonas trahens ATCC 50062]KNC52679.1 CMGC/CDK protein kinase [Thecamonas trahens ATCC 50062]|eukprot:XP_013755226.1 CMGC/CDK protein kinase [Thecamonas trahens ATCC 50062]
MPLLRCSLNNLIGSLAVADTAHIIRCLASGLAYCHARDVLHRDIKPANVLVSASGCVKLCDFGLSRVYYPLLVESDVSWARLTPRVCTLWYRPPELLLARASAYSSAVDVWGLGLIGLELFKASPVITDHNERMFSITLFNVFGCPSPVEHVRLSALIATHGEAFSGAQDVLDRALDEIEDEHKPNRVARWMSSDPEVANETWAPALDVLGPLLSSCLAYDDRARAPAAAVATMPALSQLAGTEAEAQARLAAVTRPISVCAAINALGLIHHSRLFTHLESTTLFRLCLLCHEPLFALLAAFSSKLLDLDEFTESLIALAALYSPTSPRYASLAGVIPDLAGATLVATAERLSSSLLGQDDRSREPVSATVTSFRRVLAVIAAFLRLRADSAYKVPALATAAVLVACQLYSVSASIKAIKLFLSRMLEPLGALVPTSNEIGDAQFALLYATSFTAQMTGDLAALTTPAPSPDEAEVIDAIFLFSNLPLLYTPAVIRRATRAYLTRNASNPAATSVLNAHTIAAIDSACALYHQVLSPNPPSSSRATCP